MPKRIARDKPGRRQLNQRDPMLPTTPSYSSEAGWPRQLETPFGAPVVFKREFKLVVPYSWFGKLVSDVLNTIENDVIHVFSPEDVSAFLSDEEAAPATVAQEAAASTGAGGCETRGSDPVFLGRRANIPVSIREWLPVACQWIGCINLTDKHADDYGIYSSNAFDVIFAPAGPVPILGPAGLRGYIALNARKCPQLAKEKGEDAVRLVIAHELVHAIDMLPLLVPAVQDWETFWKKALDQGDRSSAAVFLNKTSDLILDQYETYSEYQKILAFWGKERTDAWWTAFNGTPPPLPENAIVQA